MTAAERLRDEGRLEGEQRGRREGEQQVELKGASHFLMGLLERKFGSVPAIYQQCIDQASSAQLQAWCLKLLNTNSLSAFRHQAL